MSRLDLITEALWASFGSASKLAAAGDICLASAKNYRAGKGVPNVVTLAKLIRHSPGLLAAFVEYVGLDEASLEREAARITEKLAELQEQRATLHASLDAAKARPVGSVRLGVRKDAAYAEAATARVLKP